MTVTTIISLSANASASDLLRGADKLKIAMPEMSPDMISFTPAECYHNDHYLPLCATEFAQPEPAHQEWVNTTSGVKPYKVLDDLTFAGIPIFTAGIIAKSEKKSFRQNSGNKHTLVTSFKTEVDNYTQFFGPALATGLKLAGVEGRSDWRRYLSSAAMSYGFMALFVNSIKYTAKEMRPDGSTRNSWPSGHTATAFVGATILHKEYGMTRSPWYSVAGYGVATATGVMRVLNNRHWVSDVLSGAGIGILSGELGYAMSDLIFKSKGLRRSDFADGKNIIDHPSFFSISMGLGFGSRNVDFDLGKFELDGYNDGDKGFNLKLGTATVVGAEGAYFFNKYIGVGGRLRVYSSPIKGWDGIEKYAWDDMIETLYGDGTDDPTLRRFIDGDGTSPALVEDAYFTIKSDHLTEFTADLGLYFNLPLSRRLALGSKLLFGRSIMQEVDLNATVTGGRREAKDLFGDNPLKEFTLLNDKYTSEWDYFTAGGNNTMKIGTGISLTYAYKENYAWRLFLDYDYSRKTYDMTYNPARFIFDSIGVGELIDYVGDSYITTNQKVKKNRHTFVLGGSFTISF
ncbi:MAG: phosphatase PAP2 family protein [Bacteroidaceae bacterium]|nr:phosphatase PAP2 family protein [Bacteroidaceae bacterium]